MNNQFSRSDFLLRATNLHKTYRKNAVAVPVHPSNRMSLLAGVSTNVTDVPEPNGSTHDGTV